MSSKSKRRAAFVMTVCSALLSAGTTANAEDAKSSQQAGPVSCIQAVFMFQPRYDAGGFSGLRLYPNGEDGSRAFAELHIQAGDLFVGSLGNKTPQSLVLELESLLLRQVTDPRMVPFVRDGKGIEVPVPAGKASEIFPGCK